MDNCPHCGSDQIYDQWYGLEREEACDNCGKTWMPEPEAECCVMCGSDQMYDFDIVNRVRRCHSCGTFVERKAEAE
jgi:uncharacterized protein (DUF983 family)